MQNNLIQQNCLSLSRIYWTVSFHSAVNDPLLHTVLPPIVAHRRVHYDHLQNSHEGTRFLRQWPPDLLNQTPWKAMPRPLSPFRPNTEFQMPYRYLCCSTMATENYTDRTGRKPGPALFSYEFRCKKKTKEAFDYVRDYARYGNSFVALLTFRCQSSWSPMWNWKNGDDLYGHLQITEKVSTF